MIEKNLEQHVMTLEKEVADLKRQLEDQPRKHPLSDSNGKYSNKEHG